MIVENPKHPALLVLLLVSTAGPANAAEPSNWSIDVGARFFKYSATGRPAELGFNPVFERWEGINQNRADYTVSSYEPLEPLYFNMSFGVDLFIRYCTYLLLKLGYDYSNPFGIGGSGSIDYTGADGVAHRESKQFSFTTHQINTFVGPVVPLAGGDAEIYLAFSPMAPTWVRYHEAYSHTADGTTVEEYDRRFRGFFGSCRALLGLQVRVTESLSVGSEATFTFLNYMKLTSGDLADHSFRFPAMKWNVTMRYTVL